MNWETGVMGQSQRYWVGQKFIPTQYLERGGEHVQVCFGVYLGGISLPERNWGRLEIFR